MADLLRARAGLQPEKPALIEEELVVSWQQRNERANRAANALAGLGVAGGDREAIMALNPVAAFEASGALAKLQAIGVPVTSRLRGTELAYILNDSGARVICAGPEFVDHVEV